MTEYFYSKYNDYLDKDTLLFWMKFYFNGSVSKVIAISEDFKEPTKESIEKGNEEFISFSDKITHLFNDKLYGFYMSVFNDLFPEKTYSNNSEEDDIPDEDWEEEYLSDDPMDYLPKNPSIEDLLSMHYSCDGQCYSSTALMDIFERFNISFMGLTGDKTTLNIYANMFIIEIYKFADAIDISVKPSEIEWSEAAIKDYFSMFKDNKLINKKGNMRTYDSSVNKFYSYLKESECILSNFFYDGDEHLHALFSLAMDGLIKIHSIKDNCVHIDAEDFVNHFKDVNTQDLLNNKTDNKTVDKAELTSISKLSQLDIEIISARAYLEENTVDRVTYKKIAEFLSNNGIYKITENNIKQKVSWIYNKLGIQDLASAVGLLKKADKLISFDV